MATLDCKGTVFEDIEAVLWDKDGTLADSHAFLRKLAQARSRQVAQQIPGIEPALMAAFGCEAGRYDPAGLMAVGTRYDNEIAAAAYIAATGRSWAESVQLAQVAFQESDRRFTRKADFTPPFVGIPELMHHWHQQGLKMAVLSGDTTANIQDFLERYALSPFVLWSAGSEAPPTKPDPQMAWMACQQLAVAPDRCLIIGDSELDSQLARNSGSRGFISVTWGGSPAIATADAVLDTVAQFAIG
jgi:phosphoglycolate phosphatase